MVVHQVDSLSCISYRLPAFAAPVVPNYSCSMYRYGSADHMGGSSEASEAYLSDSFPDPSGCDQSLGPCSSDGSLLPEELLDDEDEEDQIHLPPERVRHFFDDDTGSVLLVNMPQVTHEYICICRYCVMDNYRC